MSASHVAAVILLSCLLSLAAAESSYVDGILNHEAYRKCNDLGKVSDRKDYLVRTFLSPGHKKAAYLLAKWMGQAGMTTWIDVMRNVHGYIPGSDPSVPPLYLGSHYDTAIDAGKYDGQLGILTAIAAVKATLVDVLESQGRLTQLVNVSAPELVIPPAAAEGLLAHGVHIVAFADEEGIRFQSTFLGSRALAGTVAKYGMLAATDKDGVTIEEAVQMEGVDDVPEALRDVVVHPSHIRGYVEVHIEQGPVLESVNQPLAVVSAIAGQRRLLVTVSGEQGHAGTVPMSMRRDALVAAAELMSMIERRCGGGPRFSVGPTALGGTDDSKLVCTVGEVAVHPGASNVIPGQAVFSVDIRTPSDTLLEQVQASLTDGVNVICAERGVTCAVEVKHVAGTVYSDWDLTEALKIAIRNANAYAHPPTPAAALAAVGACAAGAGGPNASAGAGADDDAGSPRVCVPGAGGMAAAAVPGAAAAMAEVPVMVSGAGHDAMAMAEVTKVAMVFVRCKGGLSHTPLEDVLPGDVAVATRTLYELFKMELL